MIPEIGISKPSKTCTLGNENVVCIDIFTLSSSRISMNTLENNKGMSKQTANEIGDHNTPYIHGVGTLHVMRYTILSLLKFYKLMRFMLFCFTNIVIGSIS